MSEACQICCEASKTWVHCNFCQYDACRGCVQKFLVHDASDPHCMNCNHGWNREFLAGSLTKEFLNGAFKQHREQILFEREKCLLPEAQAELARRRDIQRCVDEVSTARKKILDLEREIIRVQEKAQQLKAQKGTPVRREFIRKCPFEGCRGFLSTQWKCDVCENQMCSRCNECVAEGHECDPDAVETMKLLKKDTKPCVKCGCMIFKISGCAQMWCPECHTAFDWNTGAIETKIHNPHYYEFKRKEGTLEREPGDVPCDEIPHVVLLKPMALLMIHRLLMHIQYDELRKPEAGITVDIRILYLTGELTENQFKRKLQQTEKKREKQRDIKEVFRMVLQAGSDLLTRCLLASPVSTKAQYPWDGVPDELRLEYERIREYANAAFQTISKRYNGAAPCIDSTFYVV